MRNTKKKGFTLVELVIVVAIISILSAVLIPTVAGLIEKANFSADQVAVRNMNTALAMVDKEDVEDINDAVDILADAGFNTKKSLNTISAGYKFLWDPDLNKIVLAKGEEVVFPEGIEYNANSIDLGEQYKYVDVKATTPRQLKEALEYGNEYIKLEYNLELNKVVTIKEDSNITLDLNGKVLDASGVRMARPFELSDGTNLTINATNSVVKCGEYGLVRLRLVDNASVTINGGTFEANTTNAAFVRVVGDDVSTDASVSVTLNNVTYTDASNDQLAAVMDSHSYMGALALNVTNCTFSAKNGFALESGVNAAFENVNLSVKSNGIECGGTMTIKNSTITTEGVIGSLGVPGAVMAAFEGSVTVENSSITAKDGAYAFYVLNTGGTITATGCTVTGTASVIHPDTADGKGTITIN